ncbi:MULTISPECIES: MmgE/PrpD family protein [unclassified Achromobacter]|uniref:MmgE/PrpD family protein n=1 Tax=unclassified Achromobacter TaxID=2626865 RepID=UPI000B51CE4A|nr:MULTISPECIES: MmgE/PrpD family protein [unclassified Achromobacter]OWT80701.1 hypothetical protein CEY05_04800 [Achromobacter sp. HZ34]OWT81217.1 hypothetical protein CEY04_04790 [Achromobacter sp. HZ28]
MKKSSSLSETLADFALATDAAGIPDDVRSNAWLHLIDAYGIALLVSRSRYADALARYLDRQPASGPATVWGMNRSVPLATALLANGILAGSVNLDDTHNESQLHPGAHLVPLALGLGEREQASGRSVIDALALGNEVACRLACVAPGAFGARGMHSSSVLGKAYSTMMSARLLGLDQKAAVSAIGHAASQAGGTLQCYLDGTWTLAFHHGWVAASSLYAAELGQAGFSGPRESLDGPFGLFSTLLAGTRTPPDYARAVHDLGTHWENRAMSFKPYATGCVIHPFIDAALALSAEHGFDTAQIQDVTAVIADYLVPIVCEPQGEKRRPTDVFNARVSLQFILASTLVHGRFDLESITPDALLDPAILALAQRVNYQVDPDVVPRRHFQACLRITLRSGQVLECKLAPWLRMHIGEPDTGRQVEAKFLDNVGRVCERPEKILDLARALNDDLKVDRFVSESQAMMARWSRRNPDTGYL